MQTPKVSLWIMTSTTNWFAKLIAALKEYGEEVILIVLVCIDDLIIAGNNENVIGGFKRYLNTFLYERLGKFKVETYKGFSYYALGIISKTRLLCTKPIGFPLKQNHRLALANDAILEDLEHYRQLVGG
ncbi:hypothetical protein CR513_34483, partial [Mucuna pruriens]